MQSHKAFLRDKLHPDAGLLAGLLATVLLGTAAVTADDWPRWRGPHFDGISRETTYRTDWPAGGPKRLWEVEVGIGYSSMSVSQGRVFTMGNFDDVDQVTAIDAVSGRIVWTHRYPCPAKDPNGYHGTRVTPTVDGNRVYTLSRRGHLFCLTAEGGKVVWSKDFTKDYGAKAPTWGYAGSPLALGRLLITEVGGKGTSVVAFDKLTGQEVWRAGNDKVAYSSIIPFVLDGQTNILVLSADALTARSATNGKELWRVPWKTRYDVNAATPVLSGRRVFISSGYGKGCAWIEFGADQARTLWSNTRMRNHVSTSVIWDGFVYGFDERQLKCLDLATGEEKWGVRDYGKGSLLKAGKHWILYSDRGEVALADLGPDGCRERASFQALEGKATWAVPVLANGLLYCRNLDHVACFDLRP